jgi:hypothetical protein
MPGVIDSGAIPDPNFPTKSGAQTDPWMTELEK